MDPKLEEVFKLSGVPSYTFVPPARYPDLLVCLRRPGRGLVVEGPSGIGKTTAVVKALEELGKRVTLLRARRDADREIIGDLPNIADAGIVVIDDFHRLHEDTRKRIADYMKLLADEESETTKLVVVGVNRAGDALIQFATDLTGRIDFVKFGREPEASVERLIHQGTDALDISLSTTPQIIEGAQGSFYLAQRLCHDTCLLAGITEKDTHRDVSVSHELVVEKTMDTLDRTYFDVARKFAIGSRLRREGRAPYLHMLNWLGTSESWAIALEEEMNLHPEEKASVGQVVAKDYLKDLLEGEDKEDFARVLHFDSTTKVLSAEDPQFVFYLRNVGWQRFAKRVGFLRTQFTGRYDIALSFAGPDRDFAERLFTLLSEDQELAVFYDKNEQHRILAEDIEEYLAPIYRSEAGFVVPLLGPTYPERVWTRFESKQFEQRFGENAVIPVIFKNAPLGAFDKARATGGVTFDPEGNVEDQLQEISRLITKKVAGIAYA